jgi:alpha-L-fucosidase
MSETNMSTPDPGLLAHLTAGGPAASRRALLGAAGLAGAAGVAAKFGFFAARADAATSDGPYSATWASVDQHTAAPEWFQDAKFGIYYHWGVYSVPAFESEWYPRNMYNPNDPAHQHHIQTYGDPGTVFPYNNFIDGGHDLQGNYVQFKPQLKSRGGSWDPHEWAQLFSDAGAKFAGPVAEHHDGFSMWDSQVNEWNAAKRGPQLDLVKLHSQAIRGRGLKFMVSLHHAYNFNGYYQFVPPQPTESL